jgi:hypothetical protein
MSEFTRLPRVERNIRARMGQMGLGRRRRSSRGALEGGKGVCGYVRGQRNSPLWTGRVAKMSSQGVVGGMAGWRAADGGRENQGTVVPICGTTAVRCLCLRLGGGMLSDLRAD